MITFYKFIASGLVVASLHEGGTPESYPPEKADPAKYHLPGETPPPDPSLITFRLAASTATSSTVSLRPSMHGITE